MKSQWMLGVLVAGMMATAGCQTNHAVVRGQNPAPSVNGPMPGPIHYDGLVGADTRSCPPEWARHPSDCPENYHWPKHHHTFDYRQPKNLSYPPQNQPAGVVVYPYYTCKGPSDFFMK